MDKLLLATLLLGVAWVRGSPTLIPFRPHDDLDLLKTSEEVLLSRHKREIIRGEKCTETEDEANNDNLLSCWKDSEGTLAGAITKQGDIYVN